MAFALVIGAASALGVVAFYRLIDLAYALLVTEHRRAARPDCWRVLPSARHRARALDRVGDRALGENSRRADGAGCAARGREARRHGALSPRSSCARSRRRHACRRRIRRKRRTNRGARLRDRLDHWDVRCAFSRGDSRSSWDAVQRRESPRHSTRRSRARSSRSRRCSAPSPSARSALSSSRASSPRSPCAHFSARIRRFTSRRTAASGRSRSCCSTRCSESRAGSASALYSKLYFATADAFQRLRPQLAAPADRRARGGPARRTSAADRCSWAPDISRSRSRCSAE